MALQIVLVDDTAPGALQNAGITSDGTDLTSTIGYIGTTGSFSGTVATDTDLTVGGTASFTGDITINDGTFYVTAATGDTTVGGELAVTSNALVGGAISVTGTSIFSGVIQYPTTQNASATDPIIIDITKSYQGYTIGADDVDAALTDGVGGQRIIINLYATGGGNLVVTPANLYNGTTLTFDVLGEACELIFVGTEWIMISGNCTIA